MARLCQSFLPTNRSEQWENEQKEHFSSITWIMMSPSSATVREDEFLSRREKQWGKRSDIIVSS